MTLIRVTKRLTGNELDSQHWPVAADLTRVFFNLWLFRDAESNMAIRLGYLEQMLSQVADGFPHCVKLDLTKQALLLPSAPA